ncbi:MAG: pilin [Candidatus Paceibacterota bacterium]
MKKTIIKTILLVCLFWPKSVLGALENIYPPIPISLNKTLTITASSNATEYLLYLFAFFSGLGTIIALGAMIWAGVEMILSHGNPQKFSEAKSKAQNALIGLLILFGAYLILNVVNSEIKNVKVEQIDCNQEDICVARYFLGSENQKISYSSSLPDSPNLDLKSNEVMVIKRFKGLKEIWGFPELDFQGTPFLIQGYRNDDESDLNNDLPAEITIDSSVKSVRAYIKQPGIYLYDGLNYQASKIPPLFLRNSTVDLGEFKNKIKSIQIFNEPNFKYYAVVFAIEKYNDSYDYNFYPQSPSSDCSDVIEESDSSFSGPSGSILIFKSSDSFLAKNHNPGITFYNTLNCYIPLGSVSGQLSECSAPFQGLFKLQTIPISNCSGISAGDVLSVRLSEESGVLMIAESSGKRYCNFFDIDSVNIVSGNCISDNIFFRKAEINNFIIIPYEKKL